MSEEYVRAKIKEALEACDGDKHDAQKLLVTWAVRDQPLLLGLTKPHLKAIAMARVESILSPAGKSGGGGGALNFSKADADLMVASRAPGEKRSAVLPPPKSSMRQASAMKALADAYKKK